MKRPERRRRGTDEWVRDALPWYEVSNDSGTGPFVGWRAIDPTITFHFANITSYSQVDIHVDDSAVGGVCAGFCRHQRRHPH